MKCVRNARRCRRGFLSFVLLPALALLLQPIASSQRRGAAVFSEDFSAARLPSIPTSTVIYDARPHHLSVHTPTIEVGKGNTLVLAIRDFPLPGGQVARDMDAVNAIRFMTSNDGGKMWSKPSLFDVGYAINPAFIRTKEGDLWFFYNAKNGDEQDDNAIWYCKSTDNMRTWTRPRPIEVGYRVHLLAHNGIRLRNGDLLLGFDYDRGNNAGEPFALSRMDRAAAARNLGYDAASILAAAGCHVIVTSRDLAHSRAAAELLVTKYGADVLPLALDQSSFENVAEAAKRAHRWKGRVDILVNNAGGGSGGSVARLFERDPEEIDRMITTNLTGLLYCCREFGRLMAEQRVGRIINIASIAGMVGRDRRMYERNAMNGQPVDYAAAKAGVIGLTRDLAGYLSPLGVNVNAISPGGFHGATRTAPESFVKDYSDRTPLGRMGRDGVDLKGAILFLASLASDYVTGHNLVVDGGFSIWH